MPRRQTVCFQLILDMALLWLWWYSFCTQYYLWEVGL
jgi:hypothetical protein